MQRGRGGTARAEAARACRGWRGQGTACFGRLHTQAGRAMKPGPQAQGASSARRQVEKFPHPEGNGKILEILLKGGM